LAEQLDALAQEVQVLRETVSTRGAEHAESAASLQALTAEVERLQASQSVLEDHADWDAIVAGLADQLHALQAAEAARAMSAQDAAPGLDEEVFADLQIQVVTINRRLTQLEESSQSAAEARGESSRTAAEDFAALQEQV
jgi:cobalamin biosynthesis Co2+ chelatase CbiK